MECVRVGILSSQPQRLRDALPPPRYETASGEMGSLGPVLALKPMLIVFEFRAFSEAVGQTIELLLRHLPRAAILLCGPPLDTAQLMAAMRRGVREVLADPSEQDIRDAIERLSTLTRRRRPRKRRGQVIVVHSPKGGSGKSVLAVNLAVCCQTKGTALVDLALHAGDLDLMLNLTPAATWSELAASPGFGPDELEGVLARYGPGVRLLAAPSRAEDAELVSASLVERTLHALRQRFPRVVVDTPSMLTEPTLKAMELADRILVPVPLTLSALRQVQKSVMLWEALGIPASRVELVPWGRGDEVPVAAAERILQRPLSHRLPYDPRAVELAINMGEPLVQVQPRSRYAKAIMAIALAKGPAPVPPGGWLQALVMPFWRNRHVPAQ